MNIGLLTYVSASLMLAFVSLHWATGLGNWDVSFPLVVGNEPTGDRPWSGRIERLEIFDRAISEEEARTVAVNGGLRFAKASLLARYDFRAQAPFGDETGHLPDLAWSGHRAITSRRPAVTLTRDSWLESVAPAAPLARLVQRTRQFTVSVICAPADVRQSGPARIVSVSSNPYQRNLTIGQDATDVVVRLRTPFTGDNGTPPELRVAGVFEPDRVRHLIATYDGAVVRLFVDGGAALAGLHLDPEPRALLVGVLTSAPDEATWAVRYANPADLTGHLAVYYLATFLPLGLLIAGIVGRYGRTNRAVVLLVTSGFLLPSLLLEWLVSALGGPPFRVENVLLGVFLGGLPVFALPWRAGASAAAARSPLSRPGDCGGLPG